MCNRRRQVLLRCREPVGKLLPRTLEQRPTAVADHPAARAGGVAGIAQVEPGDAHPAAPCGGEQAAYRNPATGALEPESTRVEALDCVGGLAVRLLTRAIVQVVRQIGRDDDQRLGSGPDRVEERRYRFRGSIAGDDRYQDKLAQRHLQEWELNL